MKASEVDLTSEEEDDDNAVSVVECSANDEDEDTISDYLNQSSDIPELTENVNSDKFD